MLIYDLAEKLLMAFREDYADLLFTSTDDALADAEFDLTVVYHDILDDLHEMIEKGMQKIIDEAHEN